MQTIGERFARGGRSLLRGGRAYRAVELVLLALCAALLARLIWVIVTPLGPAAAAAPPPAALAAARVLGSFDPFFRLASGGAGDAVPKAVTSLQLTLFGTRISAATGRGGAIIAGADGVQKSYAVGDEVAPGAVLKAVGFDYVVLARRGGEESLFLDQSRGGQAPALPATAAPVAVLPAARGEAPLTIANLRTGIGFIARIDAGKVTGLFVRPQGASGVFSKVGFKEGDVVVQIGGRAVSGPGDIDALANAFPRGGTLSITLERGGEILPLVIAVGG